MTRLQLVLLKAANAAICVIWAFVAAAAVVATCACAPLVRVQKFLTKRIEGGDADAR